MATADGEASRHQANGPADSADARPELQRAPDLDVAVIGGGPGGLAAAKAILTARPDLRVAVFERSSLRPRGAGLLVHPNGISALEAIDPCLAEAVLALDWPQGACRYLKPDGSESVVLTGGDSPAPLDRLEESPDGSFVTLHFKGDHPPVTARLVVGADGGQSTVRSQAIGDGPPLFLGLALWRAIVPPPDWWPRDDPGLCQIYGVPPLTLGIGSMAHEQLYWSAAAPWPEERLDEIGGRGAAYIQDYLEKREEGEKRKHQVLDLFGDWNPQMRTLVEGTDPLTITQHAQFYRTPEACKVWGRGRVTLLGDAAHLATPGEHGATAEALRAYEAVRQPQTPDLDVAVIGGGPGGLAAAKAILTARPGLRVAAFERSSLRPKGASVMVQPNGVKALAAIDTGLAQGALDINCHLGPCWLYRNDQLQLLKGAENPTDYIESHGGPTSSCAWHELQEVQFERFEEAADGSYVTLHFKGGRPPMTARLLIGADGGQSGIREQLLADGPPLYQDTAIWRAVMPQPDWWPSDPGSYCIWGTPPNTVLAFSLNGGMLAWQAYAAWPAERLNEIGGSTAYYAQDFLAKKEQGEARRKRALEVFSGWCPQVLSLIEGADALAITEHGQFLRTPESCQVWGKGCVTLAGDAAHMATPMLAQAFEDAVALGRAIGEHGATPQALKAYEAVRQPQMSVVQASSVSLFKQFKKGNPAMKEHKVAEELGIWERQFPPLAGPSSVAA
ncbi:hypothetical protein COHA_006287 [Chlorella ohadii]|uniref:FAD-binding domain-containing protein n=1 Tax=Chlorella ohadii TaxID=2649997 RepID=A0AAD5DN17_9CHLO|nr:hypothetical protein COHA_006287 [Chlorella ohadii]